MYLTRQTTHCAFSITPAVATSPARAVAKCCDEHICLCVCLSTRISPEPHTRSLRHFLCMLPMAMAQSSGRATISQEEGAILGVFLPLTMHRNAFTTTGIIQLPITSYGRRDHSVATVSATKGIIPCRLERG